MNLNQMPIPTQMNALSCSYTCIYASMHSGSTARDKHRLCDLTKNFTTKFFLNNNVVQKKEYGPTTWNVQRSETQTKKKTRTILKIFFRSNDFFEQTFSLNYSFFWLK